MSKIRLSQSLKALDVDAVAALLAARPELIRVTDDRRRSPLHVLCGLPASEKTRDRPLALARRLLDAALDVNAPAFVEGAFQATPLWYAISRGQNLPLARFLLEQGSTPEHCLWAAAFAENVEAIDLLVRSGARVDPVTEDETPFLGAIKWSRFVGAAPPPRRRPHDQEPRRQDPPRPRRQAPRPDLLRPALAAGPASALVRKLVLGIQGGHLVALGQGPPFPRAADPAVSCPGAHFGSRITATRHLPTRPRRASC